MATFGLLALMMVASIVDAAPFERPSFSALFTPRSSNNSLLLPRGTLRNIRSAIDFSQSAPSSYSRSPLPLAFASPAIAAKTAASRPRGGPLAAISTNMGSQSGEAKPVRVSFQGEIGAYSEKSLRELLGQNVVSVPRASFESCYRAVALKECDYALVPIENSLGGSIHDNYDLMLRYELTIVAEHDFRVRHCFLTKPGLDAKEVKYAISHPQALAQCDNYLRARGIEPKATYDTAGSAKMITNTINGYEGRKLPEGCTPENTAAIASDLAGETFGLECKQEGIEDDDSNFTRFLLLGRMGVSQYITKNMPSKTSLVYTMPDSKGSLYKSLACFALRDIGMSKIESRPMSASLLNYLRFRNTISGQSSGAGQNPSSSEKEMPRFRYCFYLDITSSEVDDTVQNALQHLQEQSDFCRILGSYPANSNLVGPVKEDVDALNAANMHVTRTTDLRLNSLPSDDSDARELAIGFVGYGSFGQYLSKQISSQHNLRCVDLLDKSKEAGENNVEYFPSFNMPKFLKGLDVVIIAVPMIELEETMVSLPLDMLRNKLVVEMNPLKVYPKSILSRMLPMETDILCTNPMTTVELSLDDTPFVYEKVRINDALRADCFMSIFERARCQMVEMTAEDHDAQVADAEFVTRLTGSLLNKDLLPVSPVSSKEYGALYDVAARTTNDAFDMFYGMYKYNDRAQELVNKMRENLASVERKLAEKEAYLTASAEMKNTDRQKLIAECKMLLREMAISNEFMELESKPTEEKGEGESQPTKEKGKKGEPSS